MEERRNSSSEKLKTLMLEWLTCPVIVGNNYEREDRSLKDYQNILRSEQELRLFKAGFLQTFCQSCKRTFRTSINNKSMGQYYVYTRLCSPKCPNYGQRLTNGSIFEGYWSLGDYADVLQLIYEYIKSDRLYPAKIKLPKSDKDKLMRLYDLFGKILEEKKISFQQHGSFLYKELLANGIKCADKGEFGRSEEKENNAESDFKDRGTVILRFLYSVEQGNVLIDLSTFQTTEITEPDNEKEIEKEKESERERSREDFLRAARIPPGSILYVDEESSREGTKTKIAKTKAKRGERDRGREGSDEQQEGEDTEDLDKMDPNLDLDLGIERKAMGEFEGVEELSEIMKTIERKLMNAPETRTVSGLTRLVNKIMFQRDGRDVMSVLRIGLEGKSEEGIIEIIEEGIRVETSKAFTYEPVASTFSVVSSFPNSREMTSSSFLSFKSPKLVLERLLLWLSFSFPPGPAISADMNSSGSVKMEQELKLFKAGFLLTTCPICKTAYRVTIVRVANHFRYYSRICTTSCAMYRSRLTLGSIFEEMPLVSNYLDLFRILFSSLSANELFPKRMKDIQITIYEEGMLRTFYDLLGKSFQENPLCFSSKGIYLYREMKILYMKDVKDKPVPKRGKRKSIEISEASLHRPETETEATTTVILRFLYSVEQGNVFIDLSTFQTTEITEPDNEKEIEKEKESERERSREDFLLAARIPPGSILYVDEESSREGTKTKIAKTKTTRGERDRDREGSDEPQGGEDTEDLDKMDPNLDLDLGIERKAMGEFEGVEELSEIMKTIERELMNAPETRTVSGLTRLTNKIMFQKDGRDVMSVLRIGLEGKSEEGIIEIIEEGISEEKQKHPDFLVDSSIEEICSLLPVTGCKPFQPDRLSFPVTIPHLIDLSCFRSVKRKDKKRVIRITKGKNLKELLLQWLSYPIKSSDQSLNSLIDNAELNYQQEKRLFDSGFLFTTCPLCKVKFKISVAAVKTPNNYYYRRLCSLNCPYYNYGLLKGSVFEGTRSSSSYLDIFLIIFKAFESKSFFLFPEKGRVLSIRENKLLWRVYDLLKPYLERNPIRFSKQGNFLYREMVYNREENKSTVQNLNIKDSKGKLAGHEREEQSNEEKEATFTLRFLYSVEQGNVLIDLSTFQTTEITEPDNEKEIEKEKESERERSREDFLLAARIPPGSILYVDEESSREGTKTKIAKTKTMRGERETETEKAPMNHKEERIQRIWIRWIRILIWIWVSRERRWESSKE